MTAPSAHRTAEIVAQFANVRIAVVGDFLADVYMEAAPERLSREAPVMIVRHQDERFIPGGAANAVHNLHALGATVHPVGVVGADRDGERLLGFFENSAVPTESIVRQDDYRTVSKTRVMVGEEGRSRQQVLRIDREPERTLHPATRAELCERLRELVSEMDAVILSDYGYDLLDRGTIDVVRELSAGKVVTADSRYSLAAFRGVDLVSPNHDEASRLVGHPTSSEQDCARAAIAIREQLDTDAVLVTRGNRGMMLHERDGDVVVIPAAGSRDEVTDVSGAGDTVISLVTLARAAGATYLEAAHLANQGAGVVVMKLGAATCSREELLRACTSAPEGWAGEDG